MVCVPVRASPVAGGLPTSLVFLASSGSGDALALGSTSGCQVQLVGVAEPDGSAPAWLFLSPSLVRATTTHAAASTTIRAPAPAAIVVFLRRRSRDCSARSDISRSSRERAAAR